MFDCLAATVVAEPFPGDILGLFGRFIIFYKQNHDAWSQPHQCSQDKIHYWKIVTICGICLGRFHNEDQPNFFSKKVLGDL